MQRNARRTLRVPYRPLLLLLLILLPILAGCDVDPAPTPTPTPKPPPPTPTVPNRPRSGTLNIRLASDQHTDGTQWTLNPWLAGFDGNAQAVTDLIFSGLTKIDNHLQPQPDLAESWDISADGTLITFHLRKDVTWHDGKPFTAADVVWSYTALRQIAAQDTAMVHLQEWVQGVEAVDPVTSTVRFTLKAPYSPILGDMAWPILPSHILSGTAPSDLATSPFNEAPIGTGPFMLEERRPGQAITLKASDHYYGGGPLLERVVFVVAQDDGVSENAMRDGTLQFAQLPPAAAEKLVGEDKGIKGGSFNELGFDYIAFNLRDTHVFSDTRLRQAFAYALDKQGIVFNASSGADDPVWTDVNKAAWAYNADAPKIDGKPDESRRLLSEAGWTDTNGDGYVDRDGKPLVVSLFVRSDNTARVNAAKAMVEPLARVGISLTVQPADFQTAIPARISPNTNPPFDFDLVMLGWTRTGPDPDSFALFHSTQIPTLASPALLNIPGFQAPEFDDLAFRARATYDFGQRRDEYARMQSIVADQLPYYFLWAQKYGVVAGPTVHGDIDFASPRYLWNINVWWIE
ncbi:MAG: ABC transporter substrate-binding protein [Chloroflexia bacterium]